MADEEEEFGLNAYNDILAELGQWGEQSATSVSTPRYSSSGFSHYDESPAQTTTTTTALVGQSGVANGNDDGDAMEEEDGFSSPNGRRGSAGVQTPEPSQGHATTAQGRDGVDAEDDFIETTEQLIGDGTDSYRPYHDALLAYLQSRDRLSKATQRDNDISMMSIDGDDSAMDALDDAETKFLASLASISLSRGQSIAGSAPSNGNAPATNTSADLDDAWSEPSKNEGNFWDLLTALRESGGLPSLFYGVDGEELPELALSGDPAAMAEIAPAEALDACLGGGERGASLPLRRLTAALGWIEACHGRRFEEALQSDYEGGEDPLLPPPRRRTMWPGTLARLKRQRAASGTKLFHPDAPLQSAFDRNNRSNRSSSPVDVSSFLAPDDEADDARLMRACLMLFQSGRVEEATRLVDDCGQPWRAASWTGGEPLSADGSGNPARTSWKRRCREVSRRMSRIANADASSAGDDDDAGTTRGLLSSLAYEAAILSLLSDDVDGALRNPAFRTWEDGVHAVLRSELGIIEDDVLRSHNGARVEACERGGGHFPYPGTEFGDGGEDGDMPRGNDGNLGAALRKLEASPIERIREEAGDPFRNGMTSFLVGQGALKEYIEECAALSLEAENEDEACFLRFITHLILYVDTVLPEFCARLALPSGPDAATDGIYSLRELLILKYVAYLSSRRDLWPHVALYTSLLSSDNVLDTYSSFLIRVHGDRERRMALKRARDLFPVGLDACILRNVVRGMVLRDERNFAREVGEPGAPAGIAPADARRMRSVRWLCYHPEHGPDALVCANMLLRRFLLSQAGEDADASDRDLHAPKVFVEEILPKDLIAVAVDQCRREGEEGAVPGPISPSLVQNLEAEFLSMRSYLEAHTKYVQFLDAIAKTSPCHKSSRLVDGSRPRHEVEIADKMERNAFRQKKMGLCKIIVEFASRASDALTAVVTFAGGWLVDVNSNLTDEEIDSEEAIARSEELEAIRSTFVPRAVLMLEEVLDKTAMWLEQIAYDTLAQFEGASKDMLLTLYGSFDETYRSNDDSTTDLLVTSRAAPGYWHKKALSLASVVANDANGLHETFDSREMEGFLKLMAEHAYKLNRCTNSQNFFDY